MISFKICTRQTNDLISPQELLRKIFEHEKLSYFYVCLVFIEVFFVEFRILAIKGSYNSFKRINCVLRPRIVEMLVIVIFYCQNLMRRAVIIFIIDCFF